MNRQVSESYPIGVLLALVGGFLDAYTYLCRGGVFANAQTGNIVLFGLHLAQGEWGLSLSYLVPIAAFFFGVYVTESLKSRYKGRRGRLHWRQVTVAVESMVLLIVAFLPQGDWDSLANILVSFVCAMQVESFRKLSGSPYATTMCTGNLRSATENLYHFRRTGDGTFLRRFRQYAGIILFFIAGAAVGAHATRRFCAEAVLFGLIGLAAVFLLMFREEMDEAGEEQK